MIKLNVIPTVFSYRSLP